MVEYCLYTPSRLVAACSGELASAVGTGPLAVAFLGTDDHILEFGPARGNIVDWASHNGCSGLDSELRGALVRVDRYAPCLAADPRRGYHPCAADRSRRGRRSKGSAWWDPGLESRSSRASPGRIATRGSPQREGDVRRSVLFASPEPTAPLAVWLASDEAAEVSGETIGAQEWAAAWNDE